MKAKRVNEIQEFKRGQNIHDALNVGINTPAGAYLVLTEIYEDLQKLESNVLVTSYFKILDDDDGSKFFKIKILNNKKSTVWVIGYMYDGGQDNSDKRGWWLIDYDRNDPSHWIEPTPSYKGKVLVLDKIKELITNAKNKN